MRRTPLAAWLQKNNITRSKFAEMLGRARGKAAQTCHVSAYATGSKAPGYWMRQWIELATRGEVPAGAWDK
jgi:hypothetical protein